MKRYIRSSITPEEGEALAIKTFGAKNPGTGNIYISPDGTFINLYPEIDTHEDLCWWLEEEHDCQLEYEDEEYFIREFSWIRLRSDPSDMIIELTADRPFNSQWYSLEDWLLYCEDKYSGTGVTLHLDACDNKNPGAEYEFGTEYFAEDILKICKRYYASGQLYASRDTTKNRRTR